VAPLPAEFLARVIKIAAVQCHRAAVADAHTEDFFTTGRRPGVWGDHLWALDGPEPFPPCTLTDGDDETVVPSPAFQQAWDAAIVALQGFVQALRLGDLIATGVPESGGPRCPLDPAEWSRPGTFLDVLKGDLIEDRQGRRAVRWSAVALTALSWKQGKVDWGDWWRHETARRDLGLLPDAKRYFGEAELMIKERYGVKTVPDSGLRRLKAALYRGDKQRP
jgi:hypothetical protein